MAEATAQADSAQSLAERQARDRRVRFSSHAADRARAAFERGLPVADDRAVALMALGASESTQDAARIESRAMAGRLEERRAAVLALGELGPSGIGGLQRVAVEDDPGLREVLGVALVLSAARGAPEASAVLEALLQRADPGLTLNLRRVAKWGRGETLDRSVGALDLYYDLRWQAAQAYAFVDGKTFQQVLIADLLHDEEFLDLFVYGAAVELNEPAVRDHLFESLDGEPGEGALRAAVRAMPGFLARAIDEGGWRPPSLEAWGVMLDEVSDRGLAAKALSLVEAAFAEEPQLFAPAGKLLLEAGAPVPVGWVADRLARAPEDEKIEVILALGDRPDVSQGRDLVGVLSRRPDNGVQGAALVTMARFGFEPARERVEELLTSEPSEERRRFLVALGSVAHDPEALDWIERALALPDLEHETVFRLELGRAEAGRFHRPAALRAWLDATEGPHPLKRRVVRILGEAPDDDDLAVLRRIFPVEGDRELNVELAQVLLRARDPEALELLRTLLWGESWSRSVLAGGLIVRASGVFALVDEIELPPASADEQDLRRVGFAIGQWGGLSAVDELSHRTGTGGAALQGALLGALSTRSQ